MKIEFMNRIWVKGNGKESIVKKILPVCGIALLLLSLIQLVLGGLEDVSIFMGVIFPILLIIYSRLFMNTDGYLSCLCNLTIEEEQMTIVYPSIDYHDKLGMRTEQICIRFAELISFQYSEELHSMRIRSMPTVETTIHGEKKSENFKDKNREHTTILYLPEEHCEAVINYLRNQCNVQIEFVDGNQVT